MDFARKELKKYGWSEGEGLGKSRDGISKPLKPRLKFDSTGLGHNLYSEYNDPWWQKIYDEAASSITATKQGDDVTVHRIVDSEGASTAVKRKKSPKKLQDKNGEYKGFIKTCELNDGRERKLIRVDEKREKFDSQTEEKVRCKVPEVSNEELFRLCGGRTVHKGARHGLKMSAKLARIEEQEKNFVKCLESGKHNSNDLDKEPSAEKRRSKSKKRKERPS